MKNLCLQKSIAFIDNKTVDESCLSKTKRHLSNEGKAVFPKNLIGYINTVDWDVFPYGSNVVDDEFLSDALKDIET